MVVKTPEATPPLEVPDFVYLIFKHMRPASMDVSHLLEVFAIELRVL